MPESNNYHIPLASIGFYGSGICDVSAKTEANLNNLMEPVKEYVDVLIGQQPVHLSCRYLGYFDEVSYKQIRAIRSVIKEIYDRYLPLTGRAKNLFGSWQVRPNKNKKLIMLEIDHYLLQPLHQELLGVTSRFPVFKDVEGLNFNPHILIAQLNDAHSEQITLKILDFVYRCQADISVTFNSPYLWTRSGLKKI